MYNKFSSLLYLLKQRRKYISNEYKNNEGLYKDHVG